MPARRKVARNTKAKPNASRRKRRGYTASDLTGAATTLATRGLPLFNKGKKRIVEYDGEKWRVIGTIKSGDFAGQLHLRSVNGDAEAVVRPESVKTAKNTTLATRGLPLFNPAKSVMWFDPQHGWVVGDSKHEIIVRSFGFGHDGRKAALKFLSEQKKNKPRGRIVKEKDGLYYVYMAVDKGEVSYRTDTKADAERWLSDARRIVRPTKKRNPSRRNRHNEQAAIEKYAEFHGREPGELIEFDRQVKYPGRTAALGELVSLKIALPPGRGLPFRTQELKGFKGAMLTRHPTECQLYIEGGDQSLDLADFGIDDRHAHAVEYLGELAAVTYFTRKDHLGKEGGEANYVHRFGKNEETGESTEYPQVGYDVKNEELIIFGGGYTIPSEGIDG